MELNHLGIIVDGNGRWAKERGLIRSLGHKEGAKNLEKIILHVSKTTKIKVLSLFVFSTENFNRPKDEVIYLMNLFRDWFRKCKDKYNKENIKIVFSGDKNNLPDDVYASCVELANDTSSNTGLIVNFCLNYGGRSEIINATKNIARAVLNNEINIDMINANLFNNYLYHDLGDMDLLIRTSGEQRISNFMLWQASYAELKFVSTYFPAFSNEEFDRVIAEYYSRDRRFGSIKKG